MTLKEAREAKGLSQSAMARMLHINHSTYWNWEMGKTRIPQAMFERVVKILEVNPDDLDLAFRKPVRYMRSNENGKYEAFVETLKLLTFIQDKSITANLIDEMLNSWKKELSAIAGINE